MDSIMRYILVILLTGLFLTSCGSKNATVTSKKKPTAAAKKATTPAKPDKRTAVQTLPKETDKVTETIKTRGSDKVADYIAVYADIAMTEMKLYRIPASITLAQGILESGSGEGRLAVEANNHFGIKCHKGWTGGEIYHDDDTLQECFRTYKDASYSYRDHSLFLKDRKRYAGLFNLQTDDYVGWARGLRRAGYATDPKYPEKLISLIERYELYKYDAKVLGKNAAPQQHSDAVVAHVPGITHVVVKGDTLYNISQRYGLSVEELMRFNNLSSTAINPGQVLFIKKQ